MVLERIQMVFSTGMGLDSVDERLKKNEDARAKNEECGRNRKRNI